jgi:hypothetical protein
MSYGLKAWEPWMLDEEIGIEHIKYAYVVLRVLLNILLY